MKAHHWIYGFKSEMIRLGMGVSPVVTDGQRVLAVREGCTRMKCWLEPAPSPSTAPGGGAGSALLPGRAQTHPRPCMAAELGQTPELALTKPPRVLLAVTRCCCPVSCTTASP
jgi:hypothetical protein